MSITVGVALQQAVACLQHAGVTEPRASAEVLLADLLQVPRFRLYLEAHHALTPAQHGCYVVRLRRRCVGEPVQYITGWQEFWSMAFEVNAHVLIPRAESELLVEHGLRLVGQWRAGQGTGTVRVLDVGTGSGNLVVSLASELPSGRLWAVDQSVEALRVARRNAVRHGVATRVRWVCGDLLAPLRSATAGFALCVSNLPYISPAEWHELPREVREYEPRAALLGGEDGLAFLRRLVVAVPALLAPGGSVLLEVGWKQAAAVLECMRATGAYARVKAYRDWAGIERIVWGQLP